MNTAAIHNHISNKVSNSGGQALELYNSLRCMTTEDGGVHPLSLGLTKENMAPIMKEFLTFSTSFPYIQAGAHQKIFEQFILKGKPVPEAIEKTFVVGTFLVWDELGGHHTIMSQGQKGLSDILLTFKFHYNIFQKNLSAILGEDIGLGHSKVTLDYLSAISEGLSDLNVLNRLAHMVAFEMHAGEIVESIWNALKSLYPDINNKDLLYFNIHVGGDDPAEAYHVDMTIRLLADIVSPDDKEEFLSKFKAAYGLHIDWCNKLVRAN